MSHEPAHLGDGVYVSKKSYEGGGGQLILTTGHHEVSRADNKVFLDGTVVTALLKWLGPDITVPAMDVRAGLRRLGIDPTCTHCLALFQGKVSTEGHSDTCSRKTK